MSLELRVGSKGELFLPKALREEMNLHPGDKLFLEREKDKITIRKIKDLEEFLEETPIAGPYTQEELEEMLNLEQNSQINKTIEDL